MTQENDEPRKSDGIIRRDFVGLSVAAGLAATGRSVLAAGLEVAESNVQIKTPDGVCDAAFIRPKAGSCAGVLLWPDAFGLRPTTREMAARLAAEGYAVVVPNPFYRVAKASFSDASHFDFKNPADMAKLRPLMASVNAPGNAEKDAVAYVEFLDAQKEVGKARKIGTQGYCMGGPLVMKTAAVLPDRVGAGASFHGGRLVTEKPDSPHLLAPKIRAHMYFGIAANDDERQPEAKDKLREAFGGRRFLRKSKCMPERCMDGACRICLCRTVCRLTTRPKLSVRGESSWLCIRRLWVKPTCYLAS